MSNGKASIDILPDMSTLNKIFVFLFFAVFEFLTNFVSTNSRVAFLLVCLIIVGRMF